MTRAAKFNREYRISLTPFDRLCWQYSRAGSDTAYIATMMNATPEEVAEGITAMEMWKASNSREIVEASMNEQAIIAIEPVGRTLAEAQSAMRLVSAEIRHPKTGEVIREAVYAPDYQTRIAATEATARIVESVKERGPGVQVNVGGNQLHVNGGGGGARSFEERLRLQRESRGMRDVGNTGDGAVTIDANVAGMARDGSADEDADELEDDDDDNDNTDDDELENDDDDDTEDDEN